jgi:hypothetical protein
MIVAGAISTSGVTVLAKAFGKKRDSKKVNGQSGGGDGTEGTPEEKEKQQ